MTNIALGANCGCRSGSEDSRGGLRDVECRGFVKREKLDLESEVRPARSEDGVTGPSGMFRICCMIVAKKS